MENPTKQLDATGLNFIFWGFILIFLNFTINGFDILPNFIGFILIITGLNRLKEFSSHFQKALPFAAISLVLSFLDIFQIYYPAESVSSTRWKVVVLLNVVSCILNIFLYFYIIHGIVSLTRSCEIFDFAAHGEKIFIALLIVQIVSAFTPAAFFIGNWIYPFTIAAIILSLLVEIVFLIYIRKAFHLLNGREPA